LRVGPALALQFRSDDIQRGLTERPFLNMTLGPASAHRHSAYRATHDAPVAQRHHLVLAWLRLPRRSGTDVIVFKRIPRTGWRPMHFSDYGCSESHGTQRGWAFLLHVKRYLQSRHRRGLTKRSGTDVFVFKLIPRTGWRPMHFSDNGHSESYGTRRGWVV